VSDAVMLIAPLHACKICISGYRPTYSRNRFSFLISEWLWEATVKSRLSTQTHRQCTVGLYM